MSVSCIIVQDSHFAAITYKEFQQEGDLTNEIETKSPS